MHAMGGRIPLLAFVVGAAAFLVGCGDGGPEGGDESAADGSADLVAACDLREVIVRDLRTGAITTREEVLPRLEDLVSLAESSGSQEAEELVGQMWDAYADRDTQAFVQASVELNSICP